jgi:hypothetical protein
MSGDFNSERAQLLHESPHLGAASVHFVSEFRAADYNGRIVRQDADDTTETAVAAEVVR